MAIFKTILNNLPEVKGPLQKGSFKQKLIWTLIILVAFFVLGIIPLFGLGQNSLQQFEYLSLILGASFGSIISLGIGPIVTSSIVLQLLVGSKIINLDLTNPENRKTFQGLQKILTLFFIFFEAAIYVFLGGLTPNPELPATTFLLFEWVLVIQLMVGGILIMLMDEVISKWGFGSGVSLFIAAGVSEQVFIRALSPLTAAGTLAFGTGQAPTGAIFVLFQSLARGNTLGAALALAAIISTVAVFLFAVYAQAMKVEIPLSFGRVRGYGIRWPLKFMYTSNIPVILVAALLANIQLWARLLQNWGHPWLGTFAGNTPVSGLVSWIYSPNIVNNIITGSFNPTIIAQAVVYTLLLMGGAVLFSIFWVQTAGMDASSQARQIMASGLQVPGFRRDQRVLETILDRYILPLTVMGALAVGFLAAVADLSGALTNGTGLLLAVMIIFQLYEEIAQKHMMDMHPALRKMMEG
ncbi:MAG: preprotein translocase subunit SecY [Candidatus Woesearchaeota archaeon]|nr:MAG: preprotein translocase subunit SecY [Candidatus Woesearchaeota archaeon]